MSSELISVRTPVLVAGGGPAGLAAAAELAHHGVSSIVVEPRVEVSHSRPRAKTTSARTMELFRRWGLADTIRSAAPLSPRWCQRVVFCTSLAGEEITDFRGVFGLGADDQGLVAEAGQQVAQPVVEVVLRDHLRSGGRADLRLGERLVGFVEDHDAVTCEVERADGSTYQVSTQYLLGCDGGRSIVRAGIGATLHGGSAPQANLNTVFRSRSLRPAVGEAIHYWVLGPEVHGVAGPLDHDGTWWAGLGGVHDSGDAHRTVELLAALAGQPASELGIELLSTDPWTPRMLLADRFATERVFLVGEAAHVNPPFGGHGFNTCVGDAVNIGWKLAAVLQGWAGAGLMASYEAERRGVAEQTLASAVRNLEATGPSLPPIAEQIQEAKAEEFHSLGLVLGYSYDDSHVVVADGAAPQPPDVRTYVPSIRPGARLPHAWIGPGHALYDDLGPGMTLLHPRTAAPGALAAPAAEAERLGVPLTVIPVPSDWDWPEEFLLVRPDQHIAWRGRDFETSLLPQICGTTQPEGFSCG